METKHHSILSAPVIRRGCKTPTLASRRRRFAGGLGGVLFISVCTLVPSPAQAQCTRWDVSGQWEIRQDNGGVVKVNLQQQGANLTGTATVKEKELALPVACVVSGNITDNAFTLEVRIQGNRNAVSINALRFIGTVRPSGVIDGSSWVDGFSGPQVKVNWSGGKAKCVDANHPTSKQTTGETAPSSSAKANEAPSSDNQDQPVEHRKKKRKHRHVNDEENQGND